MNFEWDPKKAFRNRAKHSVTFEQAVTAFGDFMSVTVPDPDHSTQENRFILVGLSDQGRLLVVAYVERGDHVRIINARLASRRERMNYEEADE